MQNIGRIIGADIVEYNPSVDIFRQSPPAQKTNIGQTAMVATKIMKELVACIVRSNRV